MAAAATLAAGDFAWLTDESSEGDWSLPSKEENLLKNYICIVKTPQQKNNLTILFSDISQSSRLYELHGDAKALEIVDRAIKVISSQIISHNGRVLKKIGDEVMCVFSDTAHAVHAACALHKVVQNDKFLSEFQLALKTGIHFGEVLTEEDDVFGDNVNITARIASLAKSDQIIATCETVEQLPQDLRSKIRALGRIKVRGKQKHVEIIEVLWKEDFSELTIMPGTIQDERKPRSTLFLKYADQEIEVKDADTTVELGRGEQNTVVIQNGTVSRAHASIKHQQGKI